MNTRLKTARAELRSLTERALKVCDDPAMNVANKKSLLDRLEVQIQSAADEVRSLQSIDAQHKAWDASGVNLASLGSSQPLDGSAPAVSSGVDFGGGPLRKNNAPKLAFTEDQMRDFHDHVMSRKSWRGEVGTKTTTGPSSGGLLPDQLMPGVVPLSHEPTRLANYLPSSTMSTPVSEYLRHSSTSGAAGVVAPGGLKPNADFVFDRVEARARKQAVLTVVQDEDLDDFAAFSAWCQAELTRLIIDLESAQILSGDGTGENLLGLLSTTGILTRAKGSTDSYLDAVEMSMTDLRNGPAFADADLVVMSPTTWSATRRAKDSQGRYLAADPTMVAGNKLWGIDVVTTTGIADGTAAVLNTNESCALGYRKGITVDSSFGAAGFEHNQTTIRAEQRVALATYKPSAIVKLTGLTG